MAHGRLDESAEETLPAFGRLDGSDDAPSPALNASPTDSAAASAEEVAAAFASASAFAAAAAAASTEAGAGANPSGRTSEGVRSIMGTSRTQTEAAGAAVAVDTSWIPTGYWPGGGRYPLDATAAVAACAAFAADGNLVALQWARTQGCAWDRGRCMQVAATGGHLGVLKWIRNEVASEVAGAAAGAGPGEGVGGGPAPTSAARRRRQRARDAKTAAGEAVAAALAARAEFTTAMSTPPRCSRLAVKASAALSPRGANLQAGANQAAAAADDAWWTRGGSKRTTTSAAAAAGAAADKTLAGSLGPRPEEMAAAAAHAMQSAQAWRAAEAEVLRRREHVAKALEGFRDVNATLRALKSDAEALDSDLKESAMTMTAIDAAGRESSLAHTQAAALRRRVEEEQAAAAWLDGDRHTDAGRRLA